MRTGKSGTRQLKTKRSLGKAGWPRPKEQTQIKNQLWLQSRFCCQRHGYYLPYALVSMLPGASGRLVQQHSSHSRFLAAPSWNVKLLPAWLSHLKELIEGQDDPDPQKRANWGANKNAGSRPRGNNLAIIILCDPHSCHYFRVCLFDQIDSSQCSHGLHFLLSRIWAPSVVFRIQIQQKKYHCEALQ